MPRVAVNGADVSKAGVALPTETTGDTVNNHEISNDGNVVLVCRNSNGAATARTLSVLLTGTIDGQAPQPRTYSIPAGATRVIGPFETAFYGSKLQFNVDNAELRIYSLRIPR
jgi:hypothetical protein